MACDMTPSWAKGLLLAQNTNSTVELAQIL